MVESIREAAELAVTVATGTVLGGTILRYFFLKWLKDREAFEASTTASLDLLAAADTASERVLLATMAANRDEASTARQTLKDHVDREDRIIRDRYHELSTVVSTVVAKLEITDHRMNEATSELKTLTAELHELTISLTRLTERLPQRA